MGQFSVKISGSRGSDLSENQQPIGHKGLMCWQELADSGQSAFVRKLKEGDITGASISKKYESGRLQVTKTMLRRTKLAG